MITVCAGSVALSRLAVRHLLDRFPTERVAVVVSGEASGDDWYGVEVRSPEGDDWPASKALFAGAERVLITAERRVNYIGSQADHAVAAGARRIVYAGVADDRPWEWRYGDESTIESSGVASYTILRVNLPSESIAPAVALAQRSGELVCAFGDGLFASAALTDCAEVAAAVVVGEGHDFQSYQLAGPIGLKAPGVAAIASRIAESQILAREVVPADLARELRCAGADDFLVAELERVYRIIRSGDAHTAGTDLARLLGQPPLTVEEAVRAALPMDQSPAGPKLRSSATRSGTDGVDPAPAPPEQPREPPRTR